MIIRTKASHKKIENIDLDNNKSIENKEEVVVKEEKTIKNNKKKKKTTPVYSVVEKQEKIEDEDLSKWLEN